MTDEPSLHGPTNDDAEFDAEATRDICFKVLEQRIGPKMAAAMREDFDRHLAEDGVEQAYVCLFGKLVNAIDRAMRLVMGGSLDDDDDEDPRADDAAIVGFDGYR